MCSELCIAGYPHKVRLRRSRKCCGRRKSRWVVTGDANASHDHKRGQARDMGERAGTRAQEDGREGKQLMLGMVLPTNQGQGMTGK